MEENPRRMGPGTEDSCVGSSVVEAALMCLFSTALSCGGVGGADGL